LVLIKIAYKRGGEGLIKRRFRAGSFKTSILNLIKEIQRTKIEGLVLVLSFSIKIK